MLLPVQGRANLTNYVENHTEYHIDDQETIISKGKENLQDTKRISHPFPAFFTSPNKHIHAKNKTEIGIS